jgi:hypothetical protein
MRNYKIKISPYFIFTKNKILNLFLILLIFISLQNISLAQELEAKDRVGFNLSIGNVFYNSQIAGYKLDIPNQSNYEKEKTPNFEFVFSYILNSKSSVDISLITNNIEEYALYKNTLLYSTILYNEATQAYYGYSFSDKSLKINDKYILFNLNYSFLDFPKLKVNLGPGICILHLKQEIYDYNRYGDYTELFTYYSQNIDKNALGLNLNLKLALQLTKILSVSLSPTYIYGFQKASPLYNSNFQYFSLIGKATFNFAKENFEPIENHKNTVLFSVGFPFGISYEYLLAKRQVMHSLRGYLANYLLFETFPGVAYNLKFGNKNVFFISELNMILRHGISIGTNIGVERLGKQKFVQRLTIGAVFNQKAISDATNITLPLAEFHFGRQF